MCKIDMYRFKGMHTIWLHIWACSHFPPWVHPAASTGWTIFHPWFSPSSSSSSINWVGAAWVCMFCISVSQFSHGFSKVTPGSVQGQNANVSVRLHALLQHIDRCLPTPYRPMSRLSHGAPTRCYRPTQRSPYKDLAMHFLCVLLSDFSDPTMSI